MRRRSVLVSAVTGALASAFAVGRTTTAEAAAPSALAHHPIVGTWMVTTPIGPSLAVFFADGTNIQGVPTTQAGPMGVTFTGAQVGTWEPDGHRRVHFTGVQLHTDASGTFVGSVTIDGHPQVSDDGQSIIDDAPETTITIRDAANAVINVITASPGSPPTTGVRMAVGAPGFAEGLSGTATPTA